MTVAAPARGRAEAAASLRRRIEERDLRCCVVGLGFVGSILVGALRSAGFEVVGHDLSDTAVERLRASHTHVRASTDPAIADGADALIVAVPLSAAEVTGPDDLVRVVGPLLERLADQRLVVLEATVPVGTTRAVAATSRAPETTFVVHVPERVQAGDDADATRGIPHLVGGIDPCSSELGRALLETYCERAVVVSRPEVSELSKLLENTFRAVGIALVSELTRIAHAFGVPASEVTAAAATKPFGYFPFHPGPGIGGYCLPNDLGLLRLSAAATGLESPFLDAAHDVIESMPQVVVDRLGDLLQELGRGLDGATVLLVGTGFKVGSSEQKETPARPLAARLQAQGARVSFLDSANETFAVGAVALPRVSRDDLERGTTFDAAVVLAGDPDLPVRLLRAAVGVVIDAGGGRMSPDGVEGMTPL